jgi:coenzyme F420-reducing hydrogenase beta subunit
MTIDTSIVHKCVICKGDIEHQKTPEGEVFWTKGHQAWPVADGKCCQVCNDNVVLPRRLEDAGFSAGDARELASTLMVAAARERTQVLEVEPDDFRRTVIDPAH